MMAGDNERVVGWLIPLSCCSGSEMWRLLLAGTRWCSDSVRACVRCLQFADKAVANSHQTERC
jgi:hypothetical protein